MILLWAGWLACAVSAGGIVVVGILEIRRLMDLYRARKRPMVTDTLADPRTQVD
jgi:hypothetical protein